MPEFSLQGPPVVEHHTLGDAGDHGEGEFDEVLSHDAGQEIPEELPCHDAVDSAPEEDQEGVEEGV